MKRVALLLLLSLVGVGGCGGSGDSEAPQPKWANVTPEQIAEAKKHGVPVAFEDAVGLRFVLIPAGTFQMGSPDNEKWRDDDERMHEVTLTKPFYLATTETTQATWSAVMGNNPSKHRGSALPATNVSWPRCWRFMKHLNRTIPGGGYRLPTEAEWEYACRAGTTTRYWSGDDEKELARVGWTKTNSDGKPHPVATKPANPWGLHDMHGSVWEWCQDGRSPYGEAPATDPMNLGSTAMMRGGSWFNVDARSACRSWSHGDDGCFTVGFRVARDVVADQPPPLASVPERGEELAEDEVAFFAWWDRLGYPDVESLRFVRVASANWIQYGDDPKTPIYDHAFLLSADAARFEVMTTDMRVKRFVATEPGAAETERIGFDEVDLEEFVTTGLDPGTGDQFQLHRWLSPNQSFRALVLARACAARGLEALAHRLCELAVREQWNPIRGGRPDPDRFAGLKRDLADDAFVGLVERVPSLAWSNAELAVAFERFARAFPDHRDAERAREFAKAYASWPESVPEVEAGSRDEETAALIRTVQRQPFDAWGSNAPEQTESPARARLLAVGAVPQLLSLVDSNAATRTVVTHFSAKGQIRDWKVLSSLGDVATALLRKLASGSLDEDWSNRPSTPEARAAKFRERAERWWASVRDK